MVKLGRTTPPTASDKRLRLGNRILDAAELFMRDGYVTTTIAAIAERAGLAVQTGYASTKSKRDILNGILDLAVSGEDEQVPIQASSRWREIPAEPNPERS